MPWSEVQEVHYIPHDVMRKLNVSLLKLSMMAPEAGDVLLPLRSSSSQNVADVIERLVSEAMANWRKMADVVNLPPERLLDLTTAHERLTELKRQQRAVREFLLAAEDR